MLNHHCLSNYSNSWQPVQLVFLLLGYQQQQQQQQQGDGEAPQPTPVPGTIHITNLGAEATVEKLEELFGSLGKIKVNCCIILL